MEEKINFYNLKSFFKYFLLSIILTIIGVLILSILLCYSNVTEQIINSSIIFVTAFSILIGTYMLERKIKAKGLIYGSAYGIIYMAVLFLLSSFLSGNFSIGSSSIIMVLVGILAGMIGGILGVNLQKKK